MLRYDLLDFRPSTLAAAAVLLSDVIVATNDESRRRDGPPGTPMWRTCCPATSTSGLLLMQGEAPGATLPRAHGTPWGTPALRRALPHYIDPKLYADVRRVLGGGLTQVEAAVEALAELHAEVYYQVDNEDPSHFQAIREKYGNRYYLGVSRECPLACAPMWPAALDDSPAPPDSPATPLEAGSTPESPAGYPVQFLQEPSPRASAQP